VPGYIDACHCGAGRGQETAPPTGSGSGPGPGRFDARGVPWPVWAGVATLALAILGGLVNLLRHHEVEPIAPLLGYVDRVPSPRPTASPSPRPSAPSQATPR
jgi:hypothetical protein